MRILYIDNTDNKGHVNFNMIHMKAISDTQNNIVDAVFNYKFYSKYHISDSIENISLFFLPSVLCCSFKSKLLWRLNSVFQLWYIYLRFRIVKYDLVVLSVYDPIVLFFAGYTSRFIIFNHNNISHLSNSLKLFFTKLISKKCLHLVFNEDMRLGLKTYISNAKIRVISHGCIDPYISENGVKKLFENKKVIFCPSTSSVDPDFIHALLNDRRLNEFLLVQNIQIVIKSTKHKYNENENVTFLSRYLTDREYQNLFCNSLAILIPYCDTFKYRTSGVLFECFANNKPFIASKIPSLEIYSTYVRYNPYFKTVEDLILNLEELITFKGAYYNGLHDLNPQNVWNNLFRSYSNLIDS